MLTDTVFIRFDAATKQKNLHQFEVQIRTKNPSNIEGFVIESDELSAVGTWMADRPNNYQELDDSTYSATVVLNIEKTVTSSFDFPIHLQNTNEGNIPGHVHVKFVHSNDDVQRYLFFQEDILLDGETYGFLGYELIQGENVEFDFFLKNRETDSLKSFNIYRLEPNEKSIPIFRQGLIDAHSKMKESAELCMGTSEQKIIERLAKAVQDTSALFTGFTLEQEDTLAQIFSKLKKCANYDYEKAMEIFEPLTTALDSAAGMEKLSLDILIELQSTNLFQKEKKEKFQQEIEDLASSLMFRTYLAYYAEKSPSVKVGQLHANRTAKMYSRWVNYKKIGRWNRKRKKWGGKLEEKRAKEKKQLIKKGSSSNEDDNLLDLTKPNTLRQIDVGALSSSLMKTRAYRKYSKFSRRLKSARSQEVRILKVDLEFQNEQLMNVKVLGRFYDKGLKDSVTTFFQNRIPYPYSRKKDVSYDAMVPLRLYAVPRHKYGKKDHLHLDDVFSNDYYLQGNTENYAPQDTVLTLIPGDKSRLIYKAKIVNLIKAKVFSDFVGLEGSNPNGLVQTEVSRRFFIYPKVFGVTRTAYFGYFNSFEPKIVLSKLEENQKSLLVESAFVAGSAPADLDTVFLSSTPMNLFRHAKFQSGGELNLLHFGLPNYHTNIYFNFGGFIQVVDLKVPEYGSDTTYFTSTANSSIELLDRVKLNDARTFNFNSTWIYPEVAIEINPHPLLNIGLTAKFISFPFRSKLIDINHTLADNSTYEFQMQELLNPFSITADIVNFKFEASVFLDKKVNSLVFFRSFYSFSPGDISQDFFQAQLGYSRDLFNFKRK